jgi:hypothetical protein
MNIAQENALANCIGLCVFYCVLQICIISKPIWIQLSILKQIQQKRNMNP